LFDELVEVVVYLGWGELEFGDEAVELVDDQDGL
jgi:hypothetical protein